MKRINLENSHVPLHYQIADYLLVMLTNGELKADERVPTEEELKTIFGVSRTTVRKSMEHLSAMGLLNRKQGRGTFWTQGALSGRREKLLGLNRQIFNITGKTSVDVLGIYPSPAKSDVALALGLEKGSPVTFVERLRFNEEGEPMSYTENYIIEEYGSRIRKKDLLRMTMLETLEKRVGVSLGRVEHEIEITRAGAGIAEKLGIATLDPVLTIRTFVCDKAKKPVEIVWTYFVESKYKFKVTFDE